MQKPQILTTLKNELLLLGFDKNEVTVSIKAMKANKTPDDGEKLARANIFTALADVRRIKSRAPDHMWDNYKAMGYTDLPEQKIRRKCEEELKKVWRKYASKQNTN